MKNHRVHFGYTKDTRRGMKTAALRIRVDPALRDAFVKACRTRDLSASQVLRAHMRAVVEGDPRALQIDLFDQPDSSELTHSAKAKVAE